MATSNYEGNQFIVSTWGSYSTTMTCTWELLSQSTSGNTSRIRLRHYFYYGGGTQVSGYGGSNYVMDGQNTYWGNYTCYPGYTLIQTKDITVNHNTDGTFPGRYVSISASGNTHVAGCSGSGTITGVPKINRQAIITSATDFNDEGNPTIKYTNPAGFRINARLEFGGVSIRRDNIENTGSYTFDLTNEERELLRSKTPNSNTLTVREVIATCTSGTTESLWSWQDKTMTIVNANPIFNNFIFEDINATTVALTGNNQNVIKNYSNIQATISTTNKATAQKSASMVKYRLVIGESSIDISYNDEASVSSIINNASTGTINVYAIDSRGNSTMVTKLANEEINYEPVYTNINNSNFQRDDNRVGDNGVLTLNGTFWNDDFGDVNNSLSVSYRLKKSDSSTWIVGTTTITPTISNNTFSFNGMIASDNPDTSWDLESSYDLEITVSDELSTSITTYVLASAVPTLSLDKEGVGVMCAYDTSKGGYLQVNGKPILSNEMIVDYTFEENTSTVSFTDLNISPGENYKFRIVGSASGNNGDIAMTLNDIDTGYFSVGIYDNGTSTSDVELNKNAGYKHNKPYFYYALHLGVHQTIIEGIISTKYNIEQDVYSPYVRWRSYIVWSGHQLISDVVGTMAGSIETINKITFSGTPYGTVFKKGTRIQIIKINNDFTI